jgi:serine phosphatase RsbU (regulator of sigma subunit)
MGEEFGEERLVQRLQEPWPSAHAQLERVLDDVTVFAGGTQFDDITLILARARGAHEAV